MRVETTANYCRPTHGPCSELRSAARQKHRGKKRRATSLAPEHRRARVASFLFNGSLKAGDSLVLSPGPETGTRPRERARPRQKRTAMA